MKGEESWRRSENDSEACDNWPSGRSTEELSDCDSEGEASVTAGCKFMVKITLCCLSHPHTYTLTLGGSLSSKFSSVSLGPQGPPSIQRHSPQKAPSLITAAILGASSLLSNSRLVPMCPSSQLLCLPYCLSVTFILILLGSIR